MKEHCLFKEALKLYPKSTQEHKVCTVGHCMSNDCYVGQCPDESCLLYSSLALCFSFPFLCKFMVFSMIFLIFVVDGHLRDKSIANYNLCLVPKRLWKLGLAL